MEQWLELKNDVDSLQRMLRILTRDVQQLKVEVVTLSGKNSILQEQINLLLHKRFGANTEKYRAEQSDLFNEAEAFAEESDTQEHQVESCDETELDPTELIFTLRL
ncbi:MAG: transposase [Methylococcaceae bacterium]